MLKPAYRVASFALRRGRSVNHRSYAKGPRSVPPSVNQSSQGQNVPNDVAAALARFSKTSRFALIGGATASLLGLQWWISQSQVAELAAANSAAKETSEVASQAEVFYNDAGYSRQKLLEFLKLAVKDHPQSVDLKWRLARALYDVSNEPATDKATKRTLTYEAFDVIKVAMEMDKTIFAVHKWYGIILSAIGEYEGTKTSISNAYIIRDHWQQAIELNPQDATSHHLLGRRCFNIASISWLERKIAAAIFGSPPQASYEEALEHFFRSEALDPGGWKKNSLMIGQCYVRLHNKSDARIWLEKAVRVPIKSEEDREAHKEAESMLKSL